MSREEIEAKQKLFNGFLDQLSEHFENVQLFVNFTCEGETHKICNGRGNCFSRHAQVRDYVLECDEITKYDKRQELKREDAQPL